MIRNITKFTAEFFYGIIISDKKGNLNEKDFRVIFGSM